MPVRIKLDRYLSERGKTRYWLAKQMETKFQTIDKYYKNKVVRYDSYLLSKMCDCLDCEIGDILEYVKEYDIKQEKSK